MANVELPIPRPFNGGEWRISRRVIGPRGGVSWRKVISHPATGGIYCADLEPGQYREVYWANGWPKATQFEVLSDGEVVREVQF